MPEFAIILARWAAWAPGLESETDWAHWDGEPPQGPAVPDLSWLPPMQRRRLPALARGVFHVARQAGGDDVDRLPTVLASAHGELSRTLGLLNDLAENEPLSPAAFSLSVHNAVSGQLSIALGNRAPASCVALAGDGISTALLEAQCLAGPGGDAQHTVWTRVTGDFNVTVVASGTTTDATNAFTYHIKLDADAAMPLTVAGHGASVGCNVFRCVNTTTGIDPATEDTCIGSHGFVSVQVDATNLQGTFKLGFPTGGTDSTAAQPAGGQNKCDLCLRKQDTTPTATTSLTAAIDPHATLGTAGAIDFELNKIANVAGGVEVTRTAAPYGEGYIFDITFSGGAVKGDVPELTLVDNLLTSPPASHRQNRFRAKRVLRRRHRGLLGLLRGLRGRPPPTMLACMPLPRLAPPSLHF